jgi:hypothetical protein
MEFDLLDGAARSRSDQTHLARAQRSFLATMPVRIAEQTTALRESSERLEKLTSRIEWMTIAVVVLAAITAAASIWHF